MVDASRVLPFDKGQLSPIVRTTPPCSLENTPGVASEWTQNNESPCFACFTLEAFVPKKSASFSLDPVHIAEHRKRCFMQNGDFDLIIFREN